MIPARLVSLGYPIQANTSNQTWRAVVAHAAGQTQVVLKALSQREFFNELLGAAIGRALGLNIPDTYLVIAADDPVLSNALLLSSNERLCFGSALAPYPAFNKVLGLTGQIVPLAAAALTQALKAWPGCGETIAFDTWLANIDRNVGNLLFEPSAKHVLIDHGRCFTGPNWTIADLDPNLPQLNVLATMVAHFLQDAQDKQTVRNAIIDLSLRAATIQPRPLIEPLFRQGWITAAEANAIEQYLLKRTGQIVGQSVAQANV